MCGIAGVLSDRPLEPGALEGALHRILHRGPDDVGVLVEPGGLAMGMRRLSIIDVDGGHQPIANEDESVWVVFNGEIYNHVELREELVARGHRLRTHTDTEVLVHLYEDLGTEMFAKLRGMFAIALWDRRVRRLVLGRDRLGKKPLYYRELQDGGVAFASELKALRPLMRSLELPLEISHQAIYDYLSLGVVPQPSTIYRDVFCLEPGHSAVFELGRGAAFSPYWHLAREPKEPLTFGEARERTRELMKEAVGLRLRSDVPLGVFLSGGVDSSVVAYEASQVLGGDLQTFTVKMPDGELDESDVAQRTAAALGVQNTVLPLALNPLEDLMRVVEQYDQPFADSSAIPSLAVSRLASEHVKVVLNGDGGDEVFAGYRRYLATHSARFAPIARAIPERLWGTALSAAPRRSAAGFTARVLRGLREDQGARYLVWTTDMLSEEEKRAAWRGQPCRPTEAWLETRLGQFGSPLDVQLDGDRRINLQSDLLVKMDMATMAASLEGRSPFLDHHVVEFAAKLPAGILNRGARPKALLRSAYEDVLPAEVVRGKKRGFEIPLRQWLDEDWRELRESIVWSRNSLLRDFVPSERAASRGARFGGANSGYIDYAMLTLAMWLEAAKADSSQHGEPMERQPHTDFVL